MTSKEQMNNGYSKLKRTPVLLIFRKCRQLLTVNEIKICHIWSVSRKVLSFHSAKNQQMINSQFKFEGIMKEFNFFQKIVKFEGQFDLDDQGQGQQFQIHLRHV